MSNLTKTIKLRLNVTEEQVMLFRQMTERYRQGCNFVSQYIFAHAFPLAFTKLSKTLYPILRKVFALKSQLAQSVVKTTIARYKTVKEQLYRHPFQYKDRDGTWKRITKTLDWLWNPIQFRRPQADLVRNRDYSFVEDGSILSINTLGKRTKCTFQGKPFAKYLDGTWKLGTAKLVALKGLWYLHISVSKETETFQKENVQHVVGIDRGSRFLMVSYDEKGNTDFVSGKKTAAKRHKFQEIRKELQAKGTKAAKRRLKALSGRENRWMSDVNHRMSKTLVEKYGKDTLFVLEDLTGVSFEASNLSRGAKQNYDLRSWSFYQLEQFLSYKAQENRSKVLKVSARYTSQRCPKCGTIRREHRCHHKHLYTCSCGYQSNDDRIGAMNIQQLGTRWLSGDESPHYTRIARTTLE